MPDPQVATPNGNLKPPLLSWLRSWPANTAAEILRDELESTGVVWVKQAMPKDYVLNFRQRFFEWVAPSGVLQQGTHPLDGIQGVMDPEELRWPQDLPQDERFCNSLNPNHVDNYAFRVAKMHVEDWSNQFAANNYLVDLVQRLYPEWSRPMVLRRQLFRTVMPHSPTATGVHYDQIFLRHGPPTAVTFWIPIGDCPLAMGGLIYLERSLPVGRKVEDMFTKMSQAQNMTLEDQRNAYNSNMSSNGSLSTDPVRFSHDGGEGRRWLVGDYEAGDVVLHLMHTVHASGLNVDPQNRIRLSADVRYVDGEEDYDERWKSPLCPGDRL